MRTIILSVTMSVLMLDAAFACPPPPPPPMQMPDETAGAYQARLDALHAEETAALNERLRGYQQQWWNEAQSVLLVRVERVASVAMHDNWGSSHPRSPRVYLRSVRYLKGSGATRRFFLNYTGMTDCGPYGGGDAVEGHVGDQFVVFVRAGRPNQASVITSLALDRIFDEDLRRRVDQPDAR